MSEPTLVQRLGTAAVDGLASLPAEVRAAVPGRVLDILGIAVRASTLDTSRAVARLTAETAGAPQASAVGLAERVPVAAAAFVNGVLAHSLDYDDTHLPSILHPSASVVPAVLAAAEHEQVPGDRVLAAVAVGLEITVRLGLAGYDQATRQSEFFEHGQHATSLCGAIGAAGAVAAMCSGDPGITAHAMALACSMAGGIIEANRTGGTVKRLHCGWAAQAGVSAARLAVSGITGAPTALEGRFGFFQAFLRDRWDSAPIVEGLGERWCAADIFYKPYPANHFTHAAIDAALALRAEGLLPEDVASAHLGVAGPTVRTIGEPLAAKQAPATGYQAQFSGPFAVAAGLLGGGGLGLGVEDFSDERANDPELRRLMARVTVGADPRCDAVYPFQFPAVLTVVTHDGRTLTVEVMTNRGGPQRPLSAEELARKFRDNTSGLLTPDQQDEVAAAVTGLATLPEVGKILAPLRRVGEQVPA